MWPILGLQHPEAVFLYDGNAWEEAGFDQFAEDPLRNLAHRNTVAVTARYSRGGSYLLLGCERGRLLLRNQDHDWPQFQPAPLKNDWPFCCPLSCANLGIGLCFPQGAGKIFGSVGMAGSGI